MGAEKTAWHRRQALGLAAQLPDDPHDARVVLEYCLELVDNFLGPHAALGDGKNQRILTFAPPSVARSS